ncbi:MAG: NADH-quinone oxidoreductase subunit B family protein [Desulfovibrionaceae bacterium]|nr:NADH-quinone oxidoreductase subunit B family protein [Desulfovibrionaceae bacterium]
MGLLNNLINKSRLKSPWVVHYDCGSCNGCDIEVLACLTPVYDLERFGIVNVGNPKHADVLLVTGTVNKRNKAVLKNIYDQMPEPKAVVAIGTCGMSGGMFRECYNVVGGVDKVIPVDVYVPGCPAKPEAIIDGVVKALELVKAKLEGKAPQSDAAPAEPAEGKPEEPKPEIDAA